MDPCVPYTILVPVPSSHQRFLGLISVIKPRNQFQNYYRSRSESTMDLNRNRPIYIPSHDDRTIQGKEGRYYWHQSYSYVYLFMH